MGYSAFYYQCFRHLENGMASVLVVSKRTALLLIQSRLAAARLSNLYTTSLIFSPSAS